MLESFILYLFRLLCWVWFIMFLELTAVWLLHTGTLVLLNFFPPPPLISRLLVVWLLVYLVLFLFERQVY